MNESRYKMTVIDLCSGTNGWTQAFRERGHDTFSVDKDEDFNPDMVADIRDIGVEDFPRKYQDPDVVLFSPPCGGFSVMRMGENWTEGEDGILLPDSENAEESLELVAAGMDLIFELDPYYDWIENPRGALRKTRLMEGLDYVTVTYCKYGQHSMKPTDLWGLWPDTWTPRPMCKQGGYGTITFDGREWRTDPDGFPCHHASSRGSKTSGTQNLPDGASRGRIPYGLSWDVCRACEVALEDLLWD